MNPDKKCGTCGINYKDYECCLQYTNVKDVLLMYNCSFCTMNYQKTFNENLKKRLVNTYKFCKCDISKFVLMLRKDDFPYEYMMIGKHQQNIVT